MPDLEPERYTHGWELPKRDIFFEPEVTGFLQADADEAWLDELVAMNDFFQDAPEPVIDLTVIDLRDHVLAQRLADEQQLQREPVLAHVASSNGVNSNDRPENPFPKPEISSHQSTVNIAQTMFGSNAVAPSEGEKLAKVLRPRQPWPAELEVDDEPVDLYDNPDETELVYPDVIDESAETTIETIDAHEPAQKRSFLRRVLDRIPRRTPKVEKLPNPRRRKIGATIAGVALAATVIGVGFSANVLHNPLASNEQATPSISTTVVTHDSYRSPTTSIVAEKRFIMPIMTMEQKAAFDTMCQWIQEHPNATQEEFNRTVAFAELVAQQS